MKKYFFVLIFTSFISAGANAQSDFMWSKNTLSFNWEIGVPLKANYLNSASLAGANLDFRHFINNKFSLGVAWHWNTFEEYLSPRVFENPEGSRAIFTDAVPQVYVMPMLLKAHYYFDGGKNMKPYAGLGLGAQYARQQVFYNIFVTDVHNWGFAARPEVGLMYKFDNATGGLHFNVGYNYATNQNETFRINNLQHLGISIGGWWNLY